MRVVGQARLISHVLVPADVLRVGAALDGAPLFEAPSDHGWSATRTLMWARTVSTVDECPGIRRVAQDLVDHIVRWLAPQQPSSIGTGSLQARQQQLVIAQAAQHFLA